MKFPKLIVTPHKRVQLADYSSSTTNGFKNKESAAEKLQQDILEIARLQEILYASAQKSLLIIIQGMDTSGKDGTIKHVMSGINPQGCEVHSFKRPSLEELSHDYLWRHVRALPAKGKIGIFNRSYYEETVVLRVHPELLQQEGLSKKTSTEKFWKRRFDEINNFEKFLSDNGTTILKFFLYIDKKEQRRRLLERIENPSKHWKFEISDVGERQYFGQYMKAYEDTFSHTSTAWAPWQIIPADQKWFAHLCVADVIVSALRNMKLAYPKPSKEQQERIKTAKSLLAKG